MIGYFSQQRQLSLNTFSHWLLTIMKMRFEKYFGPEKFDGEWYLKENASNQVLARVEYEGYG